MFPVGGFILLLLMIWITWKYSHHDWTEVVVSTDLDIRFVSIIYGETRDSMTYENALAFANGCRVWNTDGRSISLKFYKRRKALRKEIMKKLGLPCTKRSFWKTIWLMVSQRRRLVTLKKAS